LRTFPILCSLTQKQLYKQVLDDVKKGYTGIHPDLYKAYSGNLHKAIGGVTDSSRYGDKYFDLQQQLEANASRFAAYKAWHATQQIDRQRADKNGVKRSEEEFRKLAKITMNAFNRYQVAEYNTAVARTRTAKQWIDFNADPTSNELYPNLKWLPSRSADPREEHIKFYGMILPKNHPFWNENQPGNLWNCKCDWEETDESSHSGEIPHAKIAKGLEGNPGETGEVFTNKASYFQVNKKTAREVEESAFNIQRKEAIQAGKTLYNKKAAVDLGSFGTVDVGFNKRGCKHLANDMKSNDNVWIKNQIIPYLDKYLKNGKFIAYEPNAKLNEKPNATRYYYVEIMLPNKKQAYIGIEENAGLKQYIAYTITSTLRKTAIKAKSN
jgi:hypothetical protein